MKKTGIQCRVISVVTAFVVLLMAAPVFAFPTLSAGNTVIRNRASVTFSDAAGNNPSTVNSNMVEVTVTTVNVAPVIGAITPSPGTTGATGATQVYSVEVISNSNGPGAITLSAADGTPNNISVSATTPSFVPASVFLGSTIIDPSDAKNGVPQPQIANNGTIIFAIPNDGGVPTDVATTGGATGNAIVNALAVNDTVYIYDGTTRYGKFTVTAVTDNATGTGTTATPSSITLQNTSGVTVFSGGFTPQYGWMIVEAKNVAMTVTQGTVTVPSNPASWVTTITGSMGGQTSTNTVTTNAGVASLTVNKYVRNVTVPVAGSNAVSPPISTGATYYQSGVSGKPGDVMEYLFVINNGGAANATKVQATDNVPTYTKLQTPYTGTSFALVKRGGSATEVTLKPAMENPCTTTTVACANTAGAATTAGTLMTFYLGNGSAHNLGGTIANSETAYVIYQVKID